jgi:hypothetical protein
MLATAEQISKPLQLTGRTVRMWATAGILPVALRRGKVLRFHPPSVAAALGLPAAEFCAAIAQADREIRETHARNPKI